MLKLLEIAALCDGVFAERVSVAARVLAHRASLSDSMFEDASPGEQVLRIALMGGDLSRLVFSVAMRDWGTGLTLTDDGDLLIPDEDLLAAVDSAIEAY